MEFTRIKNDINGNPRFVVHFLAFLRDDEKYTVGQSYEIALKRSRQLGGKKFHNKQYGGGIVFQMYESQQDEMTARIKQIREESAQ